MSGNSSGLPETAFSCASRRPIRSSIPPAPVHSWSSFIPRRCWMSRLRIVLIALAFGLAACRQDMHDQPRYKPFAGTDFFGDGRSERPPVEGTVARGFLRLDPVRYTGRSDNKDADTFPFPITRADLLRG